MNTTLTLTQALVRIDSITPNDKGCQKIMGEYLKNLDFTVSDLKFAEVDNFWATHGTTSPVFVFAGHTDVVPVGAVEQWDFPPFSATVKDGLLYGRGAADMKGSLAAMLHATKRFIADYPNHKGTIGYLITADEEGSAVNGTVKVAQHLKRIEQKVDYCLLGEPSSTNELGDFIKNGRRGSLSGTLTIIGRQGHVAYPHLAKNPIHLLTPALSDLICEVWDSGNQHFPATSFQVSNIQSGTGVNNVIPANAQVVFNFRYSTESSHQDLQKRLCAILDKHQLKYKIQWQHSGYPFLTNEGKLVNACIDATQTVKGIKSKLSTAGGTSDGRFIAPILKAEVVELGPLNATIHQVNECVSQQDLDDLTDIYYQILKNILS